MFENTLQNIEGVVLVVVAVGWVLGYTLHKLAQSRPDFRVGAPIFVAYAIRLAAIAGIGATGLGATLRGGDETTFLYYAKQLAMQPLGHGDLPHGSYQLHVVIFALQLKVGFLTEGALRVTQVGIALLGVVLIVAAVYDLADGRAARLAAWLMALEPASIFFNSALHKEPLMELASGLVVFGGTMIWRRLDVRGILLFALGGAIAVKTRSYAGWFLVAAAVLLLLHAALRGLNRPLRAMPAIYAVAIVAFITTPVLLQASSSQNLQPLQQSQNANTAGTGEGGTGSANGSNLSLETVDFSTRSAILTHLPRRIRDLILRPYPWQLGDASQRLGAIGTLLAYALLLVLVRYLWLSRGQVFPRAGPLLYPLLFMLVAYSLSVGNAGTGFRYRSHLITLAIAVLAVLREHVLLARGEPAPETRPPPVPLHPDRVSVATPLSASGATKPQ